MVKRVIRTNKYPKLPDTFERLRAQAKEYNTTDPVQDWLNQTSLPPAKANILSRLSHSHARESTNLRPPIHSTRQLHLRFRTVASPLQPTHGNLLPHPLTSPLPTPLPPPSTYLNNKRKMPDSADTNPRQSTRLKENTKNKSVDELDMKGKEDVATRVSQRQRKDILDMPEDALGKGESSNLGKSLSGREPRAKGKGPSNDSVFGEGFVKLSMASSTPFKISSSPSKSSGSPSKGPIVLNKTERMIFIEPRITFKSLSKTNEGGYLIGKLQKLW